MPTLRVIYRSSVLSGRELVLDEPVLRLGRDPANHIPFDENADRSVSRLHAELHFEADGWVVTPSAGRVLLRRGEALVRPTTLQPGDVLELCGVGGPSIELQFEPLVAAPRRALLADFVVDHSSATVAGVPAFIAGQGFVDPSELPASLPAPSSPAEPPPTPPLLPPIDEEPAANRTMMLRVHNPEPVAPAGPNSTQFLRISELPIPAEEAPPRPLWKHPLVLVGAALAVVLIVAALGYASWSRHERQRRAVERVERLREALKLSQVAPHVSEEDWELYEEASRDDRAANPTEPAAVDTSALKAAALEAVKAAALQRAQEASLEKAAADAAAEVRRKEGEIRTALRGRARTIFAEIKRNELKRLALGRPKDRSSQLKAKALADDRVARETEYTAVLEELTAPAPPSGLEPLIRRTARSLGECEAAMPAKFVGEATAAITKLKGDAALREALTEGLKRAADFRFGPTITAALGDQGVPVEMFFIPLRESGFDERKVGFTHPLGYPKGMWQLVPTVATKYGLALGDAAANPSFDSTDERHRYEKEARAAAKALRDLYRGPAAGSALLVLATWDHGDDGVLRELKQKAGLGGDDGDPGRVSFWKLFESSALDGARREAALASFAAMAVSAEPGSFGFSFPPPLEHVAPGGE